MKILVTGAAGGLGAEIISRALRDGHKLIAADLNLTALQETYNGNESVQTVALDVTKEDSWQHALDSCWDDDGIDVVINCAGVLVSGATGELAIDSVRLQFDVNVIGLILGTDLAARKMKQARAGHIINIGSTASLFPTPGNTIYCATKYAVRAFTIAAAGDLRPHGIDVSLVCPAAIKTQMLEVQRGDKNAALTFSGPRALDSAEVAEVIVANVMVDKPLETYIPPEDEMQGKMVTSYPEPFLGAVEEFRKVGIANFESPEH